MTENKNESQIFKTKSDRQRIFEYLEEHPTMSNGGLYFMFKDISENTVRAYKAEFRRKKREEKLKPAMILVFEILNYKTTLNTKLSKAEKAALEVLELWCGYKKYKEQLIKEAVGKIKV